MKYSVSPKFQNPIRLLEFKLTTTLDLCTTLSQTQQVHAQIILHNLHQSSFLLTKLIRTLSKLQTPIRPYPLSIFRRVHYPNPFLYTALIRAYLIEKSLPNAVELYGLMRRNCISPISFTYTALLKSCCELFDLGLGMQLHCQTILFGGFGEDLYVGNCLMEMYVKCGDLGSAKGVFDEMPERDVVSYTELIVAYARRGCMGDASVLFEELGVKDKVAWTAMVNGFAQNARPRKAIEYFEKMMESGVETDEVTLIGAVSACAQLGARKYADWICDIVDRCGFGDGGDVVLGSALIDMYSKCGNVDEACRVFERMKERDVYTYSSMIMGFALHGKADAALKLFNEMEKTEIKPNSVTFIWILTACSHGGLVEEGRRLFSSMEKDYGIEISVDHYTCMVDLLARTGQLKEALKLVKSMPIEPNGAVWGAILGACRVHKDAEVAELAASHLFELEPDNIANYILLSHVYASVGRWQDTSRVRKLMRTKGLRKKPGKSWLETKTGVIHEFLSGDLTHPQSSAIMQALADLMDRLEKTGYQPNLDVIPYDSTDEEKRHMLTTHSEKLALAFGLITTGPGYTINIMKNIRICKDCHSFMCHASEVTGRNIIVRDNLRFHSFRDGTCSCNDFW